MPKDIRPSAEGLQVICLLNPGVFTFDNKTWLLVRVAESIKQVEGWAFIPALSDEGKLKIIEVPLNDPDLIASDPSAADEFVCGAKFLISEILQTLGWKNSL
jgi:predicted GH43/DUF377 family glycosyl hydrolase